MRLSEEQAREWAEEYNRRVPDGRNVVYEAQPHKGAWRVRAVRTHPGTIHRTVRAMLAGLLIAAACLVPVAGCGALFIIAPDAEQSPESSAESADFCDTRDCIESFDEGTGYRVQCADGTWSQSGGRPGACSWHGGVR